MRFDANALVYVKDRIGTHALHEASSRVLLREWAENSALHCRKRYAADACMLHNAHCTGYVSKLLNVSAPPRWSAAVVKDKRDNPISQRTKSHLTKLKRAKIVTTKSQRTKKKIKFKTENIT